MVHVPNRPHVHVRLGAFEFTFCHFNLRKKSYASDRLMSSRIALATGSGAPKPKTLQSATCRAP
jgi:hypothetical protein